MLDITIFWTDLENSQNSKQLSEYADVVLL